VVIPRFGTISPWASKATDIVHNCGMATSTGSSAASSSVSGQERPAGRRQEAQRSQPAGRGRAAARPHDRVGAARPQTPPACSPNCRPAAGERGRDRRRPCRPGSANTDLGLALSDDEIDYLVAPSPRPSAIRPTSN
jgi:phosphoribosylformylglycinamidine synthase